MINWSDLFDSYQFDKGPLQAFQPKGGIAFIEYENELNDVEEWLQYQGLGISILPLLGNGESNYVGIFTDDFLRGKVIFLEHDNPHFVPRFRNLDSFVQQIVKHDIRIDWEDLGDEGCDYPNHQEQAAPEDRNILKECWSRIENENYLSDSNRELVITTAMYLTPVTKLNTIIPFLDDKNKYIVDRAMWLLGIFHKYEPAKEKISDLLDEEDAANYIREKYYNGELIKKSFWQKLLGK